MENIHHLSSFFSQQDSVPVIKIKNNLNVDDPTEKYLLENNFEFPFSIDDDVPKCECDKNESINDENDKSINSEVVNPNIEDISDFFPSQDLRIIADLEKAHSVEMEKITTDQREIQECTDLCNTIDLSFEAMVDFSSNKRPFQEHEKVMSESVKKFKFDENKNQQLEKYCFGNSVLNSKFF